MAYTVLARKYRSWTFDELIGQEAVATTLKNAITSDRVHHGFLFCGTRGVGKTSAARILARSLNCLAREGPDVEPCRECESCIAISEGQDVDVIEIDAASNTGVDNIRELRSNANYRPARARFKIYIIDEVHMLSTGAFNALLKTLEEPPGHVKFILATTEPQKVPATIQSRCLRFDFRSISPDNIAGHFEQILASEGVKAEPAVIRRVARLANGSMRDGLSLLDQLLSMGSKELTSSMLDDVLPTPHDEVLTELLGKLADHDAAGALLCLDRCLAAGYSLDRFAEALAGHVRILMLLSVCGDGTPLVEELAGAARDELASLAGRFDPEAFVHMIAVLEELRRNVRFSVMGRALTEATLVRLASGVRYRSVQKLLDELGESSSPSPGSSSPGRAAKKKAVEPPVQREPAESASHSEPGVPARTPEPVARRETAPAPCQPAARRPVNAPPSPPPMHRDPPSTEDLKEAANDPMVREALELFDGTMVNVEKQAEKTDGAA